MKKIPKMMRQIQRQNNKSSASLSDHRLCNASVGFFLDLRRGVWITEGVLSRVYELRQVRVEGVLPQLCGLSPIRARFATLIL